MAPPRSVEERAAFGFGSSWCCALGAAGAALSSEEEWDPVAPAAGGEAAGAFVGEEPGAGGEAAGGEEPDADASWPPLVPLLMLGWPVPGPYSFPQSAVIVSLSGCFTWSPSKPCSGAPGAWRRRAAASRRCTTAASAVPWRQAAAKALASTLVVSGIL